MVAVSIQKNQRVTVRNSMLAMVTLLGIMPATLPVRSKQKMEVLGQSETQVHGGLPNVNVAQVLHDDDCPSWLPLGRSRRPAVPITVTGPSLHFCLYGPNLRENLIFDWGFF